MYLTLRFSILFGHPFIPDIGVVHVGVRVERRVILEVVVGVGHLEIGADNWSP